MTIDSATTGGANFRGAISANVLGDIARQVGGVNLINIHPRLRERTYLGSQIINEKVTHVGTDASDTITYPGAIDWLDGNDQEAPFLKIDPGIEIQPFNRDRLSLPFSILDLGKLHHIVKSTLSKYFTERTNPIFRPKLDSTIEVSAGIELPKITSLIQVLSEIDHPLARRCQDSLKTISTLISEHLSPGMETLSKPEYTDKAKRILKSERALKLFNSLVETNGSNLATQLEIETIEFATELNHALLVQDLAEYLKTEWDGTSLTDIRDSIVNKVLPELSKPEYQNPEKLTNAIKSLLLPQIRPIIKYVVDKYPHDNHAYLLGPSLIDKKANCSGKAMMISLLLQDIGLDARTAACQISRSQKQFNHAYGHVYLPNHAMLEIDGNQSSELDEANLTFGCNVAILVDKNPSRKLALSEYPDWPTLQAMHDKTFVLSNNQLSVFHRTWGTETHKVSCDENGQLPLLDLGSIYLDISSQPHLSRLQKLNYAISLLNLSNHQSSDPTIKYFAAITMIDYVESERNLSPELKLYHLVQSDRLLRKAIQQGPLYPKFRIMLANNLYLQLELSSDQQVRRNILIDIASNYREILHLARILPKSMNTTLQLTYQTVSNLIATINSSDYQSLVLNNSKTEIRHTLKESILMFESSTPNNPSEMKHKNNAISYLRAELKKI